MLKDSISKAQEAVSGKASNIATGLIETIDYIAKTRDSELQFDKTIIAEIVHCNNITTGEYYVRYQQGLFKAYWLGDQSIVYNPGTNVYVKVPNGDFSLKKIIEGSTNVDTFVSERYDYEQSENMEIYECYSNSEEYSITLNGSILRQKILIYKDDSSETDSKLFENLSLSYPNINIKADFKTDFNNFNVNSGNYGLKVIFDAKNLHSSDQENIENCELTLDISNFSGSLYDYFTYTPQYSLYNTEGKVLLKIKEIYFFAEGFSDKIVSTTSNLFVKNIKISFNEIKDESDSLYKVWVSSPQGLELVNDTDSITLQGNFLYANKNFMSSSTCKCYWFKQNPSVIAGSKLYNSYGGIGWELIENSNFNILTIKGTDVYQQVKIKFVLVYNDNLTFYYELPNPIYKKYNDRFSIIKTKKENQTYLELVDGRPSDANRQIKNIIWYITREDGSYLSGIGEGTAFLIDSYLTDSKVYFQALITLEGKDEKETDIITIQDYTLINTIGKDSINVIFSGEDNFLYDTNGDMAYDIVKKEIIITPSITYGENVFKKNISWKWHNPDGEDENLTSIPKSPSTSMLTQINVDDLNRVHFKISQRFNLTKKNNTLVLVIETIDNKIFSFSKNINFIKEGTQNAVGATYTLVIDQVSDTGQELDSNFQLLNKTDEGWSHLFLKPSIYKEGKIITDKQPVYLNSVLYKYSIVYNCKGFNLGVKKHSDNNNIFKVYFVNNNIDTRKGVDENNKEIDIQISGQYFICFTVDIKLTKDGDASSIAEEYHSNYFFPIMIGNKIDPKLLTIKNIPSEIIYNANGETSQTSERKINISYEKKPVINSNFIKSLTENINIVKYGEKEWGIVQVDKYTGAVINSYILEVNNEKLEVYCFDESLMGAIKIIFDEDKNSFIIIPIVMILSNQIASNLFDGTSIVVMDGASTSIITTPQAASGNSKGATYLTTARTIQQPVPNAYSLKRNSVQTEQIKNDESGLYTVYNDNDGILRLINKITPEEIDLMEGRLKIDRNGLLALQNESILIYGNDNEAQISFGQEEDIKIYFGRDDDGEEDPENKLHLKELSIRDFITLNYKRKEDKDKHIIINTIDSISLSEVLKTEILNVVKNNLSMAEEKKF